MARHLYHCSLRWADLDQLGHVNNVTFLDYLQAARVALFTSAQSAGLASDLELDAHIIRHEIGYRSPLILRPEPVVIETWVTGIEQGAFSMAHEILDVMPDGERRVYVRASIAFACRAPDGSVRPLTLQERVLLENLLEPEDLSPRPAVERATSRAHLYSARVRPTDLNASGHVTSTRCLEYFQEARLAFVASLDEPREDSGPFHLVVARVDVDYGGPLRYRADPYLMESRVVQVGRSSFVVGTQILDGQEVLSSGQSVLVAFDPNVQRSIPIADARRRVLEEARLWASCGEVTTG